MTSATAGTYSAGSGAVQPRKPGIVTNETVNPAKPAAGISIRSSDCQALMRHEPAADVAYRPEADGGVPPADLGAGPDFNARARDFTLALKVDLDRRLARTTGQPVGAEGVIGMIEVRDGAAYLDGAPLDGDETRAVRAACVESVGTAR